MLETVLLAGPAFAVGARRRRRDLALVAAAGATPAHLRRIVLADGVVLGAVAAAAGVALGVGVAAALQPLIEAHLSHFLVRPEVSVDIAGFNSKVFYVITDGAGAGAQVARFPVTGKTTVLDAMSNVNGLSPVSSKHHVYLVRPTDCGRHSTGAARTASRSRQKPAATGWSRGASIRCRRRDPRRSSSRPKPASHNR